MSVKSELDKFYTKPVVADICINSLSKYSADLWLEPSAGAGVFLSRLPTPRIGLDIYPDAEEILEQDFFTYEPPNNQKIAVVGNPPFGKNSSLAIKFFNKAATFASIIAFIVPKTFKKTSTINKLDTNWVLVYEEELPKNSFILFDDLGNINDYDVPCVWQIWLPGARTKIKLPTNHKDWSWTTKASAKYAIRRVGGLAGKCFDSFTDYAESSHYFIDCSEEVFSRLNSLYSSFQEAAKNTAGNPSLSKTELISIYTKHFN